ncbi:hypothetical protein TSUD_19400 [Trifolium subterraneum]|uniref:DUF4378 domain-containing protein n=1 Tax=Trifolium subterraneum TaxID=3900 RepID=A0A2Z6NEQ1_TRISU|nr:hypothetical protein TSUD_19400 [Trifolium subterraneum]
MLLTVENPEPVIETFQNHLASGTLDVLSPVFSGSNKSINSNNTNSDKCVECGALFSSEPLENHDDKIHHKHHNISISEGLPEDKLMNAKIFTTDASPHLFKDFLDALEVINTNKDFLMKYINDPGSPLPFEIHTQQQSPNFKPRRAKSISLPVYGSSSGTKDSEHTVSELIDTKGKIQSEIQNVGDLHKPSTSSSSSHKVDEVLNSDQESVERENKNISSDSSHSQVQNQVKPRNFMDLRKKIKHIIEESKSEKRRITMDAIVDKIPGGNRFSENVRKLINHSQSKGHNREGKENGTTSGYYGNRLSKSYSRNKSQLSSMRTSSLKESADRYSQLYDTCFQQETANNNEVKNPKTESLKLKTEEKSSILKTPKSFQRFLSLPNLKSQHNQSEESSLQSSPQNSIRKTEDRTINKNDDFSKSQILSPTLSDHTNEESILNDEQKQDHVKSAPESESEAEAGLDVNDKIKSNKSIVIDGLGTLKGSESAASIGSTMLVEANSTFSSEASFLDCTFELENLNGLEDQELKPVAADDELNNIFEQQDAKDENFLKFGYEIPRMEIDTNNEAAYNYVKKVLELSGFTSNESLGTWYSDNQPLDPSVYEELEGCLLLDPDCSGNCDEGGHCNHLLLFDIINEGLLEIFGRSYNYYPRPLSSLSYVHPLPNGGDNVLHKVWKLISWYLNSAPKEAYTSLDYYVAKDLAKYDGWMNLQFDSECAGLEIDDLIFDDLLEEIIYT